MKKVMKNKVELVAEMLNLKETLSQEQINELVELLQGEKKEEEVQVDEEVRRIMNCI